MKKLMKISLSAAFLFAAWIAPACAVPVTGATPCAVITDYLDQNDKPGIDSFVTYAMGQFKTLDATFAANRRGIFDLLSAGQIDNTTAIASMWCNAHPSKNAHDAAVFAYDGASGLGLAEAYAN
jgi:hypothetical protein